MIWEMEFMRNVWPISIPWRRLCARALQGRKLKGMDPRDMAHGFVGIVNSFVFEWIMSPRAYSLISKAQTIMNIFFEGVGSPRTRR